MKIGTLIVAGAVTLGGVLLQPWCVAKDNPYQSIVDRNAFSLNPPPTIETNAPPAPPNKILLTGISSMGDVPKVFLEITEPGPGKTTQKPILAALQKEYGVEVLEIDVEKGAVKVKNGGIETTLTFEKDGKTNMPVAFVNNPIINAPGTTPLTTIPTRTLSPTGTRPNVPTPVLPGSPLAPTGGGAAYPSPYTGAGTTATTAVDPGLRTIPSRTLRLDQAKPQTAEESILRVAAATELLTSCHISSCT